MDGVQKAAQIAEEVTQLFERVLARGPTGVPPGGLPPEWDLIDRRLKEAEQVLRKQLDEEMQKCQALSAAQEQAAQAMKTEAEARMEAFTTPPPPPPPLLALPFEEKHSPPALEARALVARLLALPPHFLTGNRS